MTFKKTNSMIIEQEEEIDSNHFPSKAHIHYNNVEELYKIPVPKTSENKYKEILTNQVMTVPDHQSEEKRRERYLYMRSYQPRMDYSMHFSKRKSFDNLRMGTSRFPKSVILSIQKNRGEESKYGKDDKIMRVSKKVKEFIKREHICEICYLPIKDKKKISLANCEHGFKFCESCLHHYVIYRVKKFEYVFCPSEGCQAMLDANSSFFRSLPYDIQKGYKKMHLFYETSKDPTLRLCPLENCEGTIKLLYNGPFICNKCYQSFCGKCFFLYHTGDCDSNEVNFFQDNLHFRQCRKCKFVIYKNQGCNHMTCRCGYQFCYVCGKKYSSSHECNNEPEVLDCCDTCCENCCNCDQCCRCQFISDTCGETCVCLIKTPIKVFILVSYLLLSILLFLVRDVSIVLGLLLATFFVGLFGSSFEFLCDIDSDLLKCLFLLLFPICMIIGVGMAFKEIFCETVPYILGDNCNTFVYGLQYIRDM